MALKVNARVYRPRIAILGAGITGLSAALEIINSKIKPLPEVIIFEKDAIPGGLLTSTTAGGYCWDNGMYKFLPSNNIVKMFPELFEYIEDRAQKVWINNRFYDFPYKIGDLFPRLLSFRTLSIFLEYFSAKWQRVLQNDRNNLHSWLKTRLTSKLLNNTELNTYINKLQGLDLDKVSVLLGEHRLKHIDIETKIRTIIRKSFKGRSYTKPISFLAKPDMMGVGAIAVKLAEYCESRGIRIKYACPITRISRNENNEYNVEYSQKSGSGLYICSHIISTIPLNNLARIFFENNSNLDYKNNSLRYMNMHLVFFIVDKPKINNYHLIIYSFDKKHIWKRLVARSINNNKTSVIVEITYVPCTKQNYNDNVEMVIENLINDLKLFRRNEIIFRHQTDIKQAYPVYENGFDKIVTSIVNNIQNERFQIAGRQGNHYYCSTPECIKAGTHAAIKIMSSINSLKQ